MIYQLKTRYGFVVKETSDIRIVFGLLASDPGLQIVRVKREVCYAQ